MSVVLITGAATGIGQLTARALADRGHTVYASVRDLAGGNAPHAHELLEFARRNSLDIRVVELDVRSQDSADHAVRTVLDDTGRLDVVVHNAGHLYIGYTEAFTADDIASLFDVNALGAHRVNRAALPHMRERRSGTLVYVGSTTTVSVPPFLGPYVASKFAFDALAQVTAYEVNPFGIETVIVMPGAFTKGTEHFPNASHASDDAVTHAYAALDPLVARNEQATENLFPSDVDAHPVAVAEEIGRVLDLPLGDRPSRTVIDFTNSGVEAVNAVTQQAAAQFVTRLGFQDLLQVQHPENTPADVPASPAN